MRNPTDLHRELQTQGLPVVSVSRDEVRLEDSATEAERDEAQRLHAEFDWRVRKPRKRRDVRQDVLRALRKPGLSDAEWKRRVEIFLAALMSETLPRVPELGGKDGIPEGDEIDDQQQRRKPQ